MNFPQAIFLFIAGALGGALNAVAGGGSFVTFPALLFVGIPPVQANATNCLALWVGVTASGGAYRKHFHIARRVMIPLILTSIIGGLAGALLLIRTPAQTFLRVLPWLLLGATLLFAFGNRLSGRLAAGISRQASSRAIVIASVLESLVALYGGYFGGGVGIMNLGMLAALGMTEIHAMNALKVLLGGVINGVASVTFIASKAIAWPQATVTTFGAVFGGYAAAHYAQKLPQSWIRAFVILTGLAMTIYFFIRAYA